jgi:hypothetical protein
MTMTLSDLPQTFRRSSFCETSNCAEICLTDEAVFIRNSQDSESLVRFDWREWGAFVRGVVAGEFGAIDPAGQSLHAGRSSDT